MSYAGCKSGVDSQSLIYARATHPRECAAFGVLLDPARPRFDRPAARRCATLRSQAAPSQPAHVCHARHGLSPGRCAFSPCDGSCSGDHARERPRVSLEQLLHQSRLLQLHRSQSMGAAASDDFRNGCQSHSNGKYRCPDRQRACPSFRLEFRSRPARPLTRTRQLCIHSTRDACF